MKHFLVCVCDCDCDVKHFFDWVWPNTSYLMWLQLSFFLCFTCTTLLLMNGAYSCMLPTVGECSVFNKQLFVEPFLFFNCLFLSCLHSNECRYWWNLSREWVCYLKIIFQMCEHVFNMFLFLPPAMYYFMAGHNTHTSKQWVWFLVCTVLPCFNTHALLVLVGTFALCCIQWSRWRSYVLAERWGRSSPPQWDK